MDKAGRRPLLLYPMGVMVIVLGVMTMSLNLQVCSRNSSRLSCQSFYQRVNIVYKTKSTLACRGTIIDSGQIMGSGGVVQTLGHI